MKHNPTTITNGIDEGELTDAYEEIGANEEIGETTNENHSGKLFFSQLDYTAMPILKTSKSYRINE